ncbi:MAG: amino acid permease [Bacteroidetes bacterium]|nr:amino acid permease [Bacteroidota bacterium]MBS1541176.1 amino acid permease [Bacteroidota bacterium]
MRHSLLRKKSLDQLIQNTHSNNGDATPALRRVLSVRDLTSMGIAAVIGAGIFSTIGQAAYNGGPGVVFLFLIIAVTCGFTALCYAEFAARVPVAGSAYTYTYVTIGEIAAWIIGWALILEYAISNVVVSISWSSYFVNLLEGLHIHLPAWMTTDPKTAHVLYESALAQGKPTEAMAWATAPEIAGSKLILNVPAFVIVVLITIIAYIGIRESKKSANWMVALKLAVLAFIVGLGAFYIDTDNWSPFLPNGFTGVMHGVSAIFFAYIGFDSISTTAEECANPQRDMPRGMIYSLLICSAIYIVVTLTIVGMVNYSEFKDIADPLAYVFDKIHLQKIGYIISVGAVIAATSAMLVYQLGQPRIWMSMSRDGLLPKKFSVIHPKFLTPSFATIITGVAVAVPALFIDIGLVTDLTSIGTLFAFILVCAGVLKLPRRKKMPGDKSFHLPYINGRWIVLLLLIVFVFGYRHRISDALINLTGESYQEILFLVFLLAAIFVAGLTFVKKLSLIPVLGLLFCLYLMIEIPAKSWLLFFFWMTTGLLIYFSYGRKKSKLAS